MSIATRTGDEGQTSLMYGRRVDKFDPRVEACGAVDELNAALGLARAQAATPAARDELAEIQQQLIALMGELAVAPADRARYEKDKFSRLTPEMLGHLDELVRRLEEEEIAFEGWALPGGSVAGAALDLARTVCRRAERQVARLSAAGEIDLLVLRYLNRLSDVLWLLARQADARDKLA